MKKHRSLKDRNLEYDRSRTEFEGFLDQLVDLFEKNEPALNYLRSYISTPPFAPSETSLYFLLNPMIEIDGVTGLHCKPRWTVTEKHEELLRFLMDFVEHTDSNPPSKFQHIIEDARAGNSLSRRKLRLYVIEDLGSKFGVSPELRHFLKDTIIRADIDLLGFRIDRRKKQKVTKEQWRNLFAVIMVRALKYRREIFPNEFKHRKGENAREIAADHFEISVESIKRYTKKWNPYIDNLEKGFGEFIDWPPSQLMIDDFVLEVKSKCAESFSVSNEENQEGVKFLHR